MKGFIIRQPWADLILSGEKTWEIRSSTCHFRGTVGLVCEGKYVGTVDIIGAKELTLNQYKKTKKNHQVKDVKTLPYKKTYAWVLENPVRFKSPKPYTHKAGCVIWVNL